MSPSPACWPAWPCGEPAAGMWRLHVPIIKRCLPRWLPSCLPSCPSASSHTTHNTQHTTHNTQHTTHTPPSHSTGLSPSLPCVCRYDASRAVDLRSRGLAVASALQDALSSVDVSSSMSSMSGMHLRRCWAAAGNSLPLRGGFFLPCHTKGALCRPPHRDLPLAADSCPPAPPASCPSRLPLPLQPSATRRQMGEVAANAAESAYDLVADMVSLRLCLICCCSAWGPGRRGLQAMVCKLCVAWKLAHRRALRKLLLAACTPAPPRALHPTPAVPCPPTYLLLCCVPRRRRSSSCARRG